MIIRLKLGYHKADWFLATFQKQLNYAAFSFKRLFSWLLLLTILKNGPWKVDISLKKKKKSPTHSSSGWTYFSSVWQCWFWRLLLRRNGAVFTDRRVCDPELEEMLPCSALLCHSNTFESRRTDLCLTTNAPWRSTTVNNLLPARVLHACLLKSYWSVWILEPGVLDWRWNCFIQGSRSEIKWKTASKPCQSTFTDIELHWWVWIWCRKQLNKPEEKGRRLENVFAF